MSIMCWIVCHYDNIPASQDFGRTDGMTDDEDGSSVEEMYSNFKDDYMACCNGGRTNRGENFLYLQKKIQIAKCFDNIGYLYDILRGKKEEASTTTLFFVM